MVDVKTHKNSKKKKKTVLPHLAIIILEKVFSPLTTFFFFTRYCSNFAVREVVVAFLHSKSLTQVKRRVRSLAAQLEPSEKRKKTREKAAKAVFKGGILNNHEPLNLYVHTPRSGNPFSFQAYKICGPQPNTNDSNQLFQGQVVGTVFALLVLSGMRCSHSFDLIFCFHQFISDIVLTSKTFSNSWFRITSGTQAIFIY